MPQQYRYPGAKPFEQDERNLFFGREEDIKRMFELLSVEKLMVLYGKSGLGKTSLLLAGLVPILEEDEDFMPVVLRFGSYQPESGANLSALFRHKITGEEGKAQTSPLLEALLPEDASLWAQCKTRQMQQESSSSFVLIFDQFEELFTYPDDSLQRFKEELSELIHTKIPQRYRHALRGALSENPDRFDQEVLRKFHEPLDVRVILAIRSDQLSLLNQFTDYFPEILRECYELAPLDQHQAEDAILNPAHQKIMEYASPQFDYTDEALDKILKFLTNDNQKKIESFQLQILCQHAEHLVIEQGKTVIEAQDLGDLENIYQNYYDHQIARIGSPAEQQGARILIEEGLIFEEEERRVGLYKGQITRKYGVSQTILQRLVDTHLLRAEPQPTGGVVYELSHDTLVKPILKSKERRKEQEELRRHEEKVKREHEQRMEKRQRLVKQRYRIILSTLALVVFILSVFLAIRWNQRSRQLADTLKDVKEEKQRANEALEESRLLQRELAEAKKTEAGQLRDSLKVVARRFEQTKAQKDSLAARYTNEVLEITTRVADLSMNKAALEQALRSEKEKNRELENIKSVFLQRMERFEDLTNYAERSTTALPPWYRALKREVLNPYKELKREITRENE